MRCVTFVAGAVCLLAITARPVIASTVTVHIFSNDFSINPAGQPIVDPTISVGDTVHWIWDQGFHSTTSVAGTLEQWDSGAHSSLSNFSFDHTFTHVGAFQYYCDIHGFDNGNQTAGGMAGIITVTSRSASVPAPSSLLTMVIGGVLPGIGLLYRRRRSR